MYCKLPQRVGPPVPMALKASEDRRSMQEDGFESHGCRRLKSLVNAVDVIGCDVSSRSVIRSTL